MQEEICQMISQSLARLQDEGLDLAGIIPQVSLQKNRKHGDYTCNTALVAAKKSTLKPDELAQKIVAHFSTQDAFDKIEVVAPGFINFYLKSDESSDIIRQMIQNDKSGTPSTAHTQKQKKILIEYVSANPTGPLHVGHGRGAAYGESLAQMLSAMGHCVEREYYVNDSGRQLDILAVSVCLRYLELGDCLPQEYVYPSNLYQGDYVFDLGADVRNKHGGDFDKLDWTLLSQVLFSSEDEETRTDKLIAYMQQALGHGYEIIYSTGLNTILLSIRKDLEKFGVHYKHWVSEKKIVEAGKIEAMLQRLEQKGAVYEKEGALWFRATDYQDDKDRVIRRKNGQYTYFATDIAYHLDKYERGYDVMINVWGADHHGYVPRVKSAIEALGLDADKLHIVLVQFAHLCRGEEVAMSTRAGEFVTLRELIEEVGCDAARFFYVLQKPNQHMKFDLELAKSTSMENPVYYVQYAHARIHSIFKQLAEKKFSFDEQMVDDIDFNLLDKKEERDLIQYMRGYVYTLEQACKQNNPQLLATYLRELTAQFHSYYSRYTFLVDDHELRNARLALLLAIRLLLAKGLKLIGVSAPQSM